MSSKSKALRVIASKNPATILLGSINLLALLTTKFIVSANTPPANFNTKPVKSNNGFSDLNIISPIPPITWNTAPNKGPRLSLNGLVISIANLKYILNALPIGSNIGCAIFPNVFPTHSPKKPPTALPIIGARGPKKGATAVNAAAPAIPPAACPTPAPIASPDFSPAAKPLAILNPPPSTLKAPVTFAGFALANLLMPFIPFPLRILPLCCNLSSLVFLLFPYTP